jgi:gas vesicle protein
MIKMLSKKMMCFALGVGIGVGATYFYSNYTSVDQKVKCLKRKLNKIERDMKKALSNLKPEQLQKYKTELEAKYKELMNKIDNLTIKDIKGKAREALNSIKENIKNLSNKISSLTMENNN